MPDGAVMEISSCVELKKAKRICNVKEFKPSVWGCQQFWWL